MNSSRNCMCKNRERIGAGQVLRSILATTLGSTCRWRLPILDRAISGKFLGYYSCGTCAQNRTTRGRHNSMEETARCSVEIRMQRLCVLYVCLRVAGRPQNSFRARRACSRWRLKPRSTPGRRDDGLNGRQRTWRGRACSCEGDLIAIADGSCRWRGSPNATVVNTHDECNECSYGFLK